MDTGGPRPPSTAPIADWYQALRLCERLPPAPPVAPFTEAAADPGRERAARRLDRWLAQFPFSEDGHFGRRLALDGLSRPEDLLALLEEGAEELRERTGEVPPWLAELLAAYAEPVSPDSSPISWPEAHRPGSGSSADFLVLVEPLVRRGCERLRGRLAELAGRDPALDSDAVLASLVAGLAMGLRHCLARTLVLELQVARLEEELTGDTPEERYQSFIAGLRQPETALDLLGRSPVLARYVVEKIAAWEEVALEMLGRLAADWGEIRRELLPGDDPGPLVEALGGQGDPHRGGRSVFLLRFTAGARLVYKPKPLAVDAAFQGLLAWVNGRGFEPAFRGLRLLDRGAYGWMEFIATAPCVTPEEVERFYQRQGGNLALLYLVEATDFHHENLIAAGEHPVLVDLETLFHPVLARRELGPQQADPGWSLEDSVLRGGLLPSRVWGDAERRGVDLSGLAAAGGATIPYWGTVEAGTDAMRFGPKEAVLEAAQHRPTLAGAEISLLAHRDDILAGFGRLYDLLAEHRRELLAPDGPLAAFAGCETRLVFRPTKAYFGLLDESFHPYVLGSALDRARFLDRLWAGVPERPFLERLVAFEHRDLERGDIPYFSTLPDVCDVWTSGGERLPGFFAESGLDRAARRLERMGPEDRRRQEWLIRGALAVVELDQGTPRSSYDFRESPEPATPERLLAAAKAAADRLADLAFEEDGLAHWMHVEHTGVGGWALTTAQADLYKGLPGIALALGFVGALTGDERHSRLARLALATQRRQLAQKPDEPELIGGFNGRGGLLYALTQLGVLWDDLVLLDEAEALALGLALLIEQDEVGDLIAGSAGCALALLALHAVRPRPELLDLARSCGERLLSLARPMSPAGEGLGWVVEVAGETPLAGISHGAAGIALALLRLDREFALETGGRFRQAALGALAYERTLYDPARRNWPDLRAEAREHAGLAEGEDHFMVAWCHGAPGIGLARIAGLPDLDDDAIREEIALAVETTLAAGFGTNHCLCHGDLGNAQLLLEAARATGDRALAEQAYRIAGGILAGIEREGWLYGLPFGAEPLGLMTGLAGIAYGLSRLAVPDRLPCVLTLAPPPPLSAARRVAGAAALPPSKEVPTT